MMGFLAQDRDYLRLANLDIHSFIASHMVKEPADLKWDDKLLREYLQEVRRNYPDIRDKNAKQAVLGWQLGMEGGTLFNNNRDIYPKRKDAEMAINLINSLFPRCVKYREEKMWQAHKQGYLLSPYGYLRWFWDVFRTCTQCHYRNRAHCKRCRGLGMVIGEESKEAISHDVQSCAHGHIKDVMLGIHQKGIDREGCLINQVHDDLEFDIPEGKMDLLIPAIQREMEFHNPRLINEICPQGLSIRVEEKIGRNLADMAELMIGAPSIQDYAPLGE